MKQRIVFRGISILLPALPDAIHFKSVHRKEQASFLFWQLSSIVNRRRIMRERFHHAFQVGFGNL